MGTRTSGNDGLVVSALGYGCMGLEENLGAVSVELTFDDLREIEDAAAQIEVHGARLPESVLKFSYK